MTEPRQRAPWLRLLASLDVALILLVAILLALAAGATLESLKGAEVAQQKVYFSWWFTLLLGLLGLNTAFSLVSLWPWGRRRIGYVLTHLSILVILAGAFVTQDFKVEGQLPIWEGETTARVYQSNGGSFQLPFAVRLDSFEIDYYQGTRRPAMFRSRVTVLDPVGPQRPAVIQMNQELAHGGYRLFQSSYQIEGGRERTVLSVARDPGQPIVFLGYGLLLGGMIAVATTRIVVRSSRPGSRPAAARVAVVLALLAGVASAQEEGPDLETLRRVPVQYDGRVMPLDTMARSTLFEVTGKRGEADAVEVLMHWAFDPERAQDEPIIPLSSELATELGLAGRTTIAYREVLQLQNFFELMEQAEQASREDRPVSPLQEDAQELGGRLTNLSNVFRKTVFNTVPSSEPVGTWQVPSPLTMPEHLLGASHDPALAEAMDREVSYNAVRWTRVVWILLGLSTLLSAVAVIAGGRWPGPIAAFFLGVATITMTWELALRWQVGGRVPAANMYESLLVMAWGVGVLALVALVTLRNPVVTLEASGIGFVVAILTDLLPMDPYIHPMPPVLSGTPWLAIHVPITMLSYSIFALAVIAAHIYIAVRAISGPARPVLARLSEHLYWYMLVGSILLSGGILTGSIWAASSWGRYWGWDPKEVWSLVALLAYLAILHARAQRRLGPLGVAISSIGAFWTILMTYVGVNFVLSSGLHSYGFGDSAIARWMGLVAFIEILYVIGLGLKAGSARVGGTPS